MCFCVINFHKFLLKIDPIKATNNQTNQVFEKFCQIVEFLTKRQADGNALDPDWKRKKKQQIKLPFVEWRGLKGDEHKTGE